MAKRIRGGFRLFMLQIMAHKPISRGGGAIIKIQPGKFGPLFQGVLIGALIVWYWFCAIFWPPGERFGELPCMTEEHFKVCRLDLNAWKVNLV